MKAICIKRYANILKENNVSVFISTVAIAEFGKIEQEIMRLREYRVEGIKFDQHQFNEYFRRFL